jgi:hypothetical protein
MQVIEQKVGFVQEILTFPHWTHDALKLLSAWVSFETCVKSETFFIRCRRSFSTAWYHFRWDPHAKNDELGGHLGVNIYIYMGVSVMRCEVTIDYLSYFPTHFKVCGHCFFIPKTKRSHPRSHSDIYSHPGIHPTQHFLSDDLILNDTVW